MEIHYLLTLSLLGLLISLYALKVQTLAKKKKKHKVFCDMNKTIACSDVLTDKSGFLFGVSNATLGILFYFILFLLIYTKFFFLVVYASFIAVLLSLYLFSIATFKLKKFCLICTTIHVINISLFLLSYSMYFYPS